MSDRRARRSDRKVIRVAKAPEPSGNPNPHGTNPKSRSSERRGWKHEYLERAPR